MWVRTLKKCRNKDGDEKENKGKGQGVKRGKRERDKKMKRMRRCRRMFKVKERKIASFLKLHTSKLLPGDLVVKGVFLTAEAVPSK